MAVEIKTPKCPRLNKNFRNDHYSKNSDNNTPDLEVAVMYLDNGPEMKKPIAVMCDEYDSKEKICGLGGVKLSCIYKEWKQF